MAYETGVASSPAALITKFADFAEANGWTINIPGPGGRVFVKGGIVCGVVADANGFFFSAATAYNSGNAWNNQTNPSDLTQYCNTGAGPFTAYHFFQGAEGGHDYLNIVVEISAGVFRHGLICELVKAGAYTGGTYVDSTYHNPSSDYANSPESRQHRFIADSQATAAPNLQWGTVWCEVVGRWHGLFDESFFLYNAIGSVRNQGMGWNLYNAGYSRWNIKTILEPMWLFLNRGSNLRTPLGRLPNMRYLNMQLFAPGDLYDVGGQQWMVFPFTSKTSSWGANSIVPSSAFHAYAYLRS